MSNTCARGWKLDLALNVGSQAKRDIRNGQPDAFPKYVEQTNHSKAVVRAMKGNIVKLMDKIRFKWERYSIDCVLRVRVPMHLVEAVAFTIDQA